MKTQNTISKLDCGTAAMIVRADIARFANELQPAELVARAWAVAQAHYHGYCPCEGWEPCREMTENASPEQIAEAVASGLRVSEGWEA
jgi:hypothetical protein